MIIYILVFLICVFNYYLSIRLKSNRAKVSIEIATLVLLIIFSGTRYNLGGSDYYVYKDVYESVSILSEFNLWNTTGTFGMENGYLILNSIIKTLGFTYYGFTIIIAAIFYTLFYKGIKSYFKNFSFVIIIFLYKVLFFNTFTSLRQSLAICIFIFAIKFIINKNLIKYIAAILLASFFHSSAIFLLPVYLINYIKLNNKRFIAINFTYAIIFALTLVGIIATNPVGILNSIFENNQILLEKAESYFANNGSINLFNIVEYFIVSILVALSYKKIDTSSVEIRTIIKLFLIMGLILTAFSNYEILIRMRDYFVIFYAYIIILIINATENAKTRLAIIAATIAVCFLGYIRIPLTFDGGALIPYRSTTFENVKYREEIK